MFIKNSISTSVSNLLLVVAPLAAAQSGTNSDVIEETLVIGRAQDFYLETATSVGSKLNLEIIDLPQSAQVLTEQLMIDQAARDITDLYRSIAGVSEFSYSGITFRGFRDDRNVFYDGVRGDPFSGFSVPQIYNIERVEVLKGPAAALYGGGEPGGMINYVTKKPTFDSATEVQVTAGNFDLHGIAADSRGGLSDNVAYRLAAFYETQDSFRDNADSLNQQVSASLLWQPDEATSLTTGIDYIRQDLGGARLRGVLADDDGNFILPRSFNTNEESDFQDMEAIVFQSILAHQFSDGFRVNATLRYLDNSRDQAYHEPRGWTDVNGDDVADQRDGVIRREYRDQSRANEEISLTVDFVYDFDIAGMEHQFLFGSDYFDVDTDFDFLRARFENDNVLDLNVFDPNYGETDPSTYNLRDLNRAGTQTTRYSFYVQDYVNLNDDWSIMAGFRYDNFEDLDERSGFTFSDSNIAPRAALVYKPNEDGSIYLNYSESFNPSSLSNQEDVVEDGGLDPERGIQYELGWKQEWSDGAVLTTVALYQITKQDVAQANPRDVGPGDGEPTLLNIGEVESEGLELTLVGDLTERLTVTANYAYNDTVVTEGDRFRNTFGAGDQFANAPEHQLGVWARYDLPLINSAVALGADYVSEQFSLSGQRVEPFTVFDASWTSRWDAWELQLNVRNLFDTEYAVSGFIERTGHFPGAPREIIAQARYAF